MKKISIARRRATSSRYTTGHRDLHTRAGTGAHLVRGTGL